MLFFIFLLYYLKCALNFFEFSKLFERNSFFLGFSSPKDTYFSMITIEMLELKTLIYPEQFRNCCKKNNFFICI